MKIRTILCVMLGLYSAGAVTYAISELYPVFGGCGAGCFGNELPFKNGTNGMRSVDVRYRDSGPNGFSADPAKIAGAINTAMGDWNNANTPYQFQPAQNSNNPNIEVIVVDDIKGTPRGTCMQLDSYQNPQTGEIAGARLYVKRSVFNNATQAELAQLFEHELGHFIGLRDFRGNADQCQIVMAQAQDGCHGLKAARRSRSKMSRRSMITLIVRRIVSSREGRRRSLREAMSIRRRSLITIPTRVTTITALTTFIMSVTVARTGNTPSPSMCSMM